ncbi:MAG: SRPBCC family protein [Solirubrobacteraceae bacterium]
MIKHSIEINCPAEEVFAYLDQVDRHNEWQGQLVSTTVETDGPIRVGTRVVERRIVPGGARDFPYEITEHDPPRKASFRGTAGLIRPIGTYTVDPIRESSSRMTTELELEGHGIGKLFAILARRQAARQVPVDQEKFRELLESGIALAASN